MSMEREGIWAARKDTEKVKFQQKKQNLLIAYWTQTQVRFNFKLIATENQMISSFLNGLQITSDQHQWTLLITEGPHPMMRNAGYFNQAWPQLDMRQ